MRVAWLRTALRNLDELAAFIARDDPDAAARVVRRLQEAIDRLARYPDSGRPGHVAGATLGARAPPPIAAASRGYFTTTPRARDPGCLKGAPDTDGRR